MDVGSYRQKVSGWEKLCSSSLADILVGVQSHACVYILM